MNTRHGARGLSELMPEHTSMCSSEVPGVPVQAPGTLHRRQDSSKRLDSRKAVHLLLLTATPKEHGELSLFHVPVLWSKTRSRYQYCNHTAISIFVRRSSARMLTDGGLAGRTSCAKLGRCRFCVDREDRGHWLETGMTRKGDRRAVAGRRSHGSSQSTCQLPLR